MAQRTVYVDDDAGGARAENRRRSLRCGHCRALRASELFLLSATNPASFDGGILVPSTRRPCSAARSRCGCRTSDGSRQPLHRRCRSVLPACTRLAARTPAAGALRPCRRSPPDRRGRSRQRSARRQSKMKGAARAGAVGLVCTRWRGTAWGQPRAANGAESPRRRSRSRVLCSTCNSCTGTARPTSRDDDRFRIRPGPPRRSQSSGWRFVNRVLRRRQGWREAFDKPSRVGARSAAAIDVASAGATTGRARPTAAPRVNT